MTCSEMASALPALPSSTVRSYALIGMVIYVFGFVLNGIGNGLEQFWLVPYADTMSGLGFIISLYAASLAGISTRGIALMGVVYGIGTFYIGEPHSTHIASGIGFGFEHMTHIYIGLGLITLVTASLAALVFYKTRKRGTSGPEHAQVESPHP